MRRDVEDDQTIRRFLLDDLNPEERCRIEERLLDDRDDFFEQLQVAEAELADDYVTGALSDSDRARFTESFLSTPERHAQLRFAESLRGYFAVAEPPKKTVTDKDRPPPAWLHRLSLLFGLNRPAVGFALACGLVLAVGVAAWLGLRAWQLQARLDRLQAQQPPSPVTTDALAGLQQQLSEERARREAAAQELLREQGRRAGLEQEVARLRAGDAGEVAAAAPPPGQASNPPRQAEPRGAVSRILAATLTSGVVRESGETKVLSLTPATATVRLRLDIGDEDYKHYRATLETADGRSLLSRDALRPKSGRGGRVVIFDVPARLLEGGGDFLLRLSGASHGGTSEEVGSYYFKVARN